MYHILISLYFVVSAFVAGMYLKDTYTDYVDSIKDYPKFLLMAAVITLLAIPGVIWDEILRRPAIWVAKYFQLKFFWDYFFTKEWNNLEPHQLRRNYNICKVHFNSDSLRDRIYRYCNYLVNKRNSYDPSKATEGDIAEEA